MALAMWWVLALALATATLASGTRYGDYAEVKMPEYGSAIDYDGPRDSPPVAPLEADELHKHAPDAPIDYKDEEDQDKSNKRIQEVAETDEWRNSVKKHNNYKEYENQENFDAYNSEETNFKSNLRPSKHRPRLKPTLPHDKNLASVNDKHVVRYGTSRKKHISDMESKEGMDELVDGFEDDKSIDFKEDRIKVRKNHRETTARKARRKPRDRFIKSEPNSDEEDPIMNIRKRPTKGELRREGLTDSRSLVRRPQYRQGTGPEAKATGGRRSGHLPDKYDDYAEYYDMKRVHNVKDKLMKESIDDSFRTTMHLFPMRHDARLQDDDDDNSGEHGLEGLRRLMQPESTLPNDIEEKEENDQEQPARPKMNPTSNFHDFITSELSEQPVVDPALRMVISRTPRIETTTKNTTTTTHMRTDTPISTETTTEAVEVEVEEEEEEEVVTEIQKKTTTELSLAEKSRLSILKKAQRKEMLKESATKKPPVLLQVTERRHTLVMVEPATKLAPWKSVTEITNDSPENLVRVKRLMRKKLVENAKDIHELSENWDDLVCEYVDMSLLERQSASTTSLNTILMIISLIAIVLF